MSDDVVIRAEGLGKRYRTSVTRPSGSATPRCATCWRAAPAGCCAAPPTCCAAAPSIAGDRRRGVLGAHATSASRSSAARFVGIIGRNGAGKITLLKILSRITEPTEGRVDDPRPRRQPARSRHRLPSGADRAREHLSERRDPRHDARRDHAASSTRSSPSPRSSKFLDTPVKRYSSGMYVRLAFAVAAHLEPEILIVDEVLAVGDAEFQKKCLGKMDEVARAAAAPCCSSATTWRQ